MIFCWEQHLSEKHNKLVQTIPGFVVRVVRGFLMFEVSLYVIVHSNRNTTNHPDLYHYLIETHSFGVPPFYDQPHTDQTISTLYLLALFLVKTFVHHIHWLRWGTKLLIPFWGTQPSQTYYLIYASPIFPTGVGSFARSRSIAAGQRWAFCPGMWKWYVGFKHVYFCVANNEPWS